MDNSIKFVGKIKNRKLYSFVRRENKTPLLDKELDNMAASKFPLVLQCLY